MSEPITISTTDHVLSVTNGVVYLLTPCCTATGKGDECGSGVVCRSCYREVDSDYGVAVRASDTPVLEWFLAAYTTAAERDEVRTKILAAARRTSLRVAIPSTTPLRSWPAAWA